MIDFNKEALEQYIGRSLSEIEWLYTQTSFALLNKRYSYAIANMCFDELNRLNGEIK